MPEFYTWAFPGAPVRIHLQLSVVDSLGREVKRAFEAVPSHSVEIGGLLLGTADFAASPIIEVRDFEPFLSEYRTDHRFILSESDQRKLERLLAAHASGRADGLSVVGFYRSHIGEGLSLSPQDVALARNLFSDPANVFLVVKPAADGSANAGFFFWDNGRLEPGFSYLEFPFAASQLTATAVKPRRPGPRPEPLEKKAPEPAPQELSPGLPSLDELAIEERIPRRPHGVWFVLFAVVMMALGMAGYATYMKWGATPTGAKVAETTALALQIERRGSDLRVSWNQHSFALARATDGVLVIHDGDLAEQQLHLELDQLRHGSILYSPANPTVQFRLEVRDTENVKTSETVLALTSAPAPPAGSVPPNSTAPGARATAANQPLAGAGVGQTQPASPASGQGFGDPVRVTMVDPPKPAPGANTSPTAAMHPPALPQPKLPPQAPQPDTAAGSYIPPQPMHEVQPSLPSSASKEVTQLVEVQIRVHIDDKGRVVRAEALPNRVRVSKSLIGAARNAALQWRFEPAWQGPRPVASELVLKFQYQPSSR
jgi:hypothetical protein